LGFGANLELLLLLLTADAVTLDFFISRYKMDTLMIYIFVDAGRYWQELSGPAAIYSTYYPKPFEPSCLFM
jgi:hypothetical protein